MQYCTLLVLYFDYEVMICDVKNIGDTLIHITHRNPDKIKIKFLACMCMRLLLLSSHVLPSVLIMTVNW